MDRKISRRKLVLGSLAALGALALAYNPVRNWWRLDCIGQPVDPGMGYGPLLKDPEGLLDLPAGFSYRILCQAGDAMADGYVVPKGADGMGIFPQADGGYRILRNNELSVSQKSRGPFSGEKTAPREAMYDPESHGCVMTMELDINLHLKKQFLSLAGTERNCAGAVTPWGSWVTQEESTYTPQTHKVSKAHGYSFEVPAALDALVKTEPLRAMGRFRKESLAHHPPTDEWFQTEDNDQSCFYKYASARAGSLAEGALFALGIKGKPGFDTSGKATPLKVGVSFETDWVPLKNPDPAKDTLRQTARKAGAAVFDRLEGLSPFMKGLAFGATTGGPEGLGQIWHYTPQGRERGKLTLLAQPQNKCEFFMPDSLALSPGGHLFMAEDNGFFTRLNGLSPSGEVFPFAYFKGGAGEELAGIAFSPDNRFMVVNAFGRGMTFLIEGSFSPQKVVR